MEVCEGEETLLKVKYPILKENGVNIDFDKINSDQSDITRLCNLVITNGIVYEINEGIIDQSNEPKFDIFKTLIPANEVTGLSSGTSEQFRQRIKTLKSHYNKFRKMPAKLKTFLNEKFKFSLIGSHTGQNLKLTPVHGRPNRAICHLKSFHNGAYSALNTAGHEKLGNAHFLNQLYGV